jgi:GTA TIM-barrel-like domain/Putative phage tail protein
MAQILFTEVGAALGQRILPAGLNIFGNAISGGALGRAAGAVAGRALGLAFADPLEGPRIASVHVMESREGAAIAFVYGRMRVGGQLIWAARFRETKTERRAGSKGDGKINTYSYAISLAVAVGEGVVQSVRRVWANGEPFDMSGVTCRFYSGDETQAPDPLIEMLEGSGRAPAYRGTAYIVFEDLPLDTFANRIPQFSFEIVRAPADVQAAAIGDVVRGVNIIPASGEFVYATEIVRERLFPGKERTLNAHSGEARPDFLVSLDQLQSELPNVQHAALTVGWFGTSINAGDCQIRPGVDTLDRITLPYEWEVAGVGRAGAHLISKSADGRANYGGTPSDRSVVQAITELKRRGIAVTLSPFLFMDAPGLPWRGRITTGSDKTASARDEINRFVAGPWGYRRFVLHMAALAAEAGGVDAMLIGSELRGLTRIRDASGAFAFVEALQTLAADVKLILPAAKISYAADWTEYGAYAPGDGSGDVLFPLDALWAHPAVDFVGIDWYPPMGDWRSGDQHTDWQAGFRNPDDADYLAAQLEGGEAFDWYYASLADRTAQIRTPIIDTAHGEHWIFRAKDLRNWAAHLHFARPGGVRASVPTGWAPGMKPVRLSEIGFAAVDKGGNAPNLFYDPKSSESGLPPYSTGARDDVFQRRALAVTLSHFAARGDVAAAFVWAWDGRPFPAWPNRTDVWGDGANWARGHWLNGRAGLSGLGAVVADICQRGGVEDVDVTALDGVVEGYMLDGVHAVRGALEPLQAAFGFHAVELDGKIVFRMSAAHPAATLAPGALVAPGLSQTRRLIDKAPQRLRLTYIDPDTDYQPALVEARLGGGDARLVVDVALPLAMGAGRARDVARHLLAARQQSDTATCAIGLGGLAIEPGDALVIGAGPAWQVTDITDQNSVRALSLRREIAPPGRIRAMETGQAPPPAPSFGAPDLAVIDAPFVPGVSVSGGPLLAAWADPWPGDIAVLASHDGQAWTARETLTAPATIGRLLAPVASGPHGRWDRSSQLRVFAPEAAFASASPARVLDGANAALLETAAGWELLQFASAELVGPDTWVLADLLRGQGGSLSAAAAIGARLVLVDAAVAEVVRAAADDGRALHWRARGTDTAAAHVHEGRADLAWPVAHLTARAGQVRWTRRGRDIPDNWSLPEAENAGAFFVSFDTGAGFGPPVVVNAAQMAIPPGAVGVRVSERSPDGRPGLSRTCAVFA